MASLNEVQLIGHVGNDPDVRYTQAGAAILSFSLATSETWDGKNGKQEKTEWHKIDVFGPLANALKSYIVKGKLLYVKGRLVYNEWTDKDGNKRTKAAIRVSGFNSNIILLGSPGEKREVSEEPKLETAPGDADSDVPF